MKNKEDSRVINEKIEIELDIEKDILSRELSILTEKIKNNHFKKCINCKYNEKCKGNIARNECFDEILSIIETRFKENPKLIHSYFNLLRNDISFIMNVANTGSMTPYIQYGDFVIITNGEPKKGEIICYLSDGLIKIHFFEKFKDKEKTIGIAKLSNLETEEFFVKGYLGKGIVIKPTDKIYKNLLK